MCVVSNSLLPYLIYEANLLPQFQKKKKHNWGKPTNNLRCSKVCINIAERNITYYCHQAMYLSHG